MAGIPDRPKVYHITHVDNLAGIVRDGVLWSDARRIERGLECEVVGLSSIKRQRLESRPVGCRPGTMVGQYVPFYLGPRSVMLYILHMRNHPELTYRGGQKPIVHLVADLHATVAWAEARGRRWAISDRNAGAGYASFYSRLDDLDKIDWDAVGATDWRAPDVKEGKQAEFLLFESFPWSLVERVGVASDALRLQAEAAVASAGHRPPVRVERTWYY